MIEAHTRPLRVETLKAKHFSVLASICPSERLDSLQLMLINNWLGQVEKALGNWLPATKSICLVAFEYESPIAMAVAKPCNKRGSCWSINFPDLILEPKESSLSLIQKSLLQKALEIGKNRVQSWLIRTQTNDKILLEIAREYGFQPLKFFNCWSSKSTKMGFGGLSTPNDSKYEWQKINKENVSALYRFELASQSSLHRQILDRQLKDLLQVGKNVNGVLISKRSDSNNAIAGLILREMTEDILKVELLRDLAWDERIIGGIPYLLKELDKGKRNILIETSKDDEKLSDLLHKLGNKFEYETILLGRSLWRRQENRELIRMTNKLESILGGLRPQNPPLPTPSLDPR